MIIVSSTVHLFIFKSCRIRNNRFQKDFSSRREKIRVRWVIICHVKSSQVYGESGGTVVHVPVLYQYAKLLDQQFKLSCSFYPLFVRLGWGCLLDKKQGAGKGPGASRSSMQYSWRYSSSSSALRDQLVELYGLAMTW